jgi:hypothetical protein
VRRLRLIRALREVGGLKVGTIGRIIASMEAAGQPWGILADVCDAIGESNRQSEARDTEWTRTSLEVDTFLRSRGLPARPESSSRAQLIAALIAIRKTLGQSIPVGALGMYSDAVRDLARKEVDVSNAVGHGQGGEGWTRPVRDGAGAFDLQATMEAIVYGTVLFEPVLLAFRRLWHERYAEDDGAKYMR